MNRQSINYEKLCDDIQSVLHGHKLDDVIPALSSLLAYAFLDSGQEKKKCVYYVVQTVDYVFERNKDEKTNHPQ